MHAIIPLLAAAALVLSACAGEDSAGAGGASPAGGDWPHYNRDLAGTRYSPLTQIDTENVARLVPVWDYRLGRDASAGGLGGGSELTPLVIDGVMYFATSEAVVAVYADDGEEIWRYALSEGVPSRRGLAYRPADDERGARVFFTSGRRLIALEAASGAPAAGFGEAGGVSMPVAFAGAPIVFDDLLIVGANGPPGGTRAFHALTGELVWEFLSLPPPGDFGGDTWEGSGRDLPNASPRSWAFSRTVDEAHRIVYTVFSDPGPNTFYGGDRLGDNLFAATLVALDADTGERVWHFQTTRHDIFDYDLTSPPGLLDVTVDGETVPVAALATKSGYLYLMNRLTGEPVFGIEEIPVPGSDVPGEIASATQPVPVRPPPIARVAFDPETDMVTAEDTNAEHAAFCRDLAERSGGVHNAGPFTPYVYRAAGAPPRSTALFPGSIGGSNWGGTASDPATGYVYVNTLDAASLGWMEPTPPGVPSAYRRNSIVGPTSRFQWYEGDPELGNILGAGERGWPCNRPPWGRLFAIDANTGEIAWETVLGITDDLPEDRQRTGRMNMGGPIVTAGGLVFIGATNDRRFRAFDALSGEELWVHRLEMSARAVPVTYLGRDGRQYVAVVAAGVSELDDPSPAGAEALVVFGLEE
jgi:glucose dehydrogenase